MKLGVLGVSSHFLMRVLPGLLKSKSVEVYGIASRDGLKAQKAALQYHIPKSYGSYEELLKDPAIGFVYIPLPNNMHLEWIKKAADHGKHVICEKPFALNAAEAKEAVDYAESQGIKVMEAFMYKFHPQWQHALEQVKYGEIGKVRTIHTFFGYHNTDPKNIRNIKESGGGAIYDIGCYAVSTARFLLESEPQRAFAVAEIDPSFDTDYLVNAMLDFGHLRTQFTVSTQAFPHQRVQVYGTSGILTVEIPFNMYPDVPAKIVIQNGVGTRTVELGPVDQYQIQFESFVEAVEKKTVTPIPAEDAVNNMKVLDALFKSVKSGRWEVI